MERPAAVRPFKRFGLAVAVAAIAVGGLPFLVARSGATPGTDGNQDLPSSCGLDVTLVLDDSGSIDSTEAQLVRNGAQAFATALSGTPSRLKTVVFSTKAQGVNSAGSLTYDLNAIGFRDPSSYTAPTSGAGEGATNWDDALEVARRSTGGPGDLVVLLTDGDPTQHNVVTPDGHTNNGSYSTTGGGNTTQPADLSQAVTEADLIKAAGTHMFGIGIGFTSAASEQRLNDVTGDDEMTITGGIPSPTFSQADYIVTPNFSDLQSIVRAFVRELCGDSLNVTKYLQQADGTTVRADGSTPWTYTATLTPPPDVWNNPSTATGASATLTTGDTGGLSFTWDEAQDPDSHVVDLVEDPQDGWVYNGARCEVNDLLGGPPIELFDTVGANAAGASGDESDLLDLLVESNKAVNCELYNREVRTSTIEVAKQTVPAALAGDFDFTLSKGATTIDTETGLSHGESATFVPVEPGTYAVTEAANAQFDLTGSSCDLVSTPADEAADPDALVVGEGQAWTCTFTNTAKNGSITVVKDAVGADGSFLYTSNVPGLGSFGLTTSGGTATTAKVSVPTGTYSITEASPAPWTLSGATCTGGDVPGLVNVGPAEDVVCTFTNTAPAPSIRVVKTAGSTSVLELGGPVTYTVQVINTSVEPVEITAVRDSIDGGPSIDLTAPFGPITATTCGDLIGDSLAIGASTSCTFTAQVAGLGGTSEVDEVTVTAEDSDGNQATDADTASVAIVGVKPKISVTKTPSIASMTEPGVPVTYTVAVRNDGLEPVKLDTFSEVMEAGAPTDITVVGGRITATTCGGLVGDLLPVGETASCTFTYDHTGEHTGTYADGFIDDTVTVTGSDDDGSVSASASAKVALLDAKPQITVTKTANPTSVAETGPGQQRAITYTVAVTNASVEAVTIESIVDSVEGAPATAVNGTCDDLVGDVVAPGATVTCTFTGQVSGQAGTVIDDLVTVHASDDEGNDAFDDDPASVTLTNVASSIDVTKAANVASVPENGGPVTYTVTVRNTSATDTITIGSISDSIDGGPGFAPGGTCPGLIGDALAPGASTTCQFTIDVTGNAGETEADVVTVTATDDDGGPLSDTGAASVRITDRPSSLRVDKVASVESLPEPGGDVTYTVTITNTSAADAVTIDSIVDSVNGAPATPVAGTCDDLLGTVLAPSQSVQCTFTATVGTHAGDVTSDTVTVAGTDDDKSPVSAKGSDSVVITDVGSSLRVTKDHDVASVPEPGGPVTYTVTIQNTSQVDAVTIDSIVDSVDGGAPFAVDGTCDDLVGTVLAAGASVDCSFTLPVAGDAGGTVIDVITVSGTDDDDQSVSGQASEDVDITDVKPTIDVTKTANPTSVSETAPGATETITYQVTVANTSPETLTLTSLTDSVDGGPAAAPGGTCSVPQVLPVGGSYQCSFTAEVSGGAGDVVTDLVTATATDNEQNQASDSDPAAVSFSDVGSSILVTKTADPSSVPEPGAPVTYTVTIENTSVTDTVVIGSIVDSVDGGPAVPAGGTCLGLIGDAVLPGATVSCTFTDTVSGDPGDVVSNTVTVTGTDDDGNPVSDDATETVDITDVEAALLVEKVASATTVPEPGADVTYTVTITNDSKTDDITIDSITDAVGTGAPAAVDGTCDDLVGTVLSPGEVVTCTFTVPVTGDAGDVVRDTVTVAGTDDDQQPVSGQGSESVEITDVAPTITVTKTAAPSSVPETAPGVTAEITYTVTVQNDSPETVTIDAIVDSVNGGPAAPVAGTCDDLVGTTLAAQAGTSCTFTGAVSGDAGSSWDDTVTVTVSDDDDNTADDADDASVTFTDVASSLLVTKTADPGSVPEPGGPVTYMVEITNTSTTDSVAIGSIVDSVEGGPAAAVAGTCDDLVGTSLAPGATTSCTFTMDVAGNAGDVVDDTVTVTGTDDDQQQVSDSADESVAITDVASSLSVTKVADPASVPENGGPVTYTVTIDNTSPADAVTIDSIVDSVEGGDPVAVDGTCDELVGTTLPVGGSTSCTFTMDVAGNAGDTVADTVTVSGTDDDDQPVSAQGSEVVDITDVASSLEVTKEASDTSLLEPGGEIGFTVTITNTSTTDSITLETITETVDGEPGADLAAMCTGLIGTVLEPGGSTTCTFYADVLGNAGDVITDTVTVTGTDDDGDPVSDAGSEAVDITDRLPSGSVTKDADPSSVPESGGTVTYTVVVTNTSSEPVTVTSITDEVGGEVLDVTQVAGPITATTCETGVVVPAPSPVPQNTYTCTFDYLVAPGTAGDELTDTVSVTLVDDEQNEVTPTDTEEVQLTDVAPSIVVTKVNAPETVPAPGDPVAFTVTVENTSWEPVVLTSLTDIVDGGEPIDVTEVAGAITSTDCALGTVIAEGATSTCTFTLVVASDEAATIPDEVIAVVVDDDATEATAADTAVTTVTAVSDLAIDKELVSEALEPGKVGTYGLTVTNIGPSTAVDVVVTDSLPEGLTPVSVDGGAAADCAIEGQEVTCTVDQLAPEATWAIEVDVEVAESVAGSQVTNVAEVDSPTEDPNRENNRDEETAEVGDVAPKEEDRTPIETVIVATGGPWGATAMVGLALVGLGGAFLAVRRWRLVRS